MFHIKRLSAATKWSLPLPFLKRVWGRTAQPGDIVFISTKRVGDGRWRDHALTVGDDLSEAIAELLRRYPPSSFDLYFCPLPFKSDHRQKAGVKPAGILWSDIDDGDWRLIRPSCVWRSSPGRYQAIWYIDRTLPPAEVEALNHALTIHIGADRGGWDLTQVLRIPWTRNHKYDGAPVVRPVVMSDRILDVDALTEKLANVTPLSGPSGPVSVPDVDLKGVLSKHRGNIPRGILWRLKREPHPDDDRSAYLWSIFHRLHNKGLTAEEIYAVVRNTVWNKWKDRRHGDEHLMSQILKVTGRG